MSALGPRGLNSNNSATIGGAQAVDVESRARLGGPRGLRASADVDVGGENTAAIGIGIGIGGGGGGNPGEPGSPGGPGTPGGPSAGGTGAGTGAGSSDMAAKKLRCTGVLSEPRAYDSGIVALCRDLVGG
ncbi:hypothetical protein [Ancylobacter sp. FA202]|uniref:hypothetical protein n=1 Tax=Ancylobacter sp. FA202 TaxID=1111106 RepID=UPI00036299EA|nr:hypothetical protein [Ancylobacter sp. FA202]